MVSFERLKELLEAYEVDLTLEDSPTHTIKITNDDIMALVNAINKQGTSK